MREGDGLVLCSDCCVWVSNPSSSPQQGHIVACVSWRWEFPSYLVLKDLTLVMVMFACMGVYKSRASAAGSTVLVHSKHCFIIILWKAYQALNKIRAPVCLHCDSEEEQWLSVQLRHRWRKQQQWKFGLSNVQYSAAAPENIVCSCAGTGCQANTHPELFLRGSFRVIIDKWILETSL